MIASGTRVLVTGATGFIGGRLVERLVMDLGADVQVLIRNYATASRVARFGLRMFQGDVTQPDSVYKAMVDCDIVFHCVYGNTGNPGQQRSVTVDGTRNVLEAALKHRVKRIVHISTVSVYGPTKDGDLDESAPRRTSGEVYADSKIAAEKLAFAYFKRRALPVSVIQPTIVYGPYGRTWTVSPISSLKSCRVVLVDGGTGLCNAVYVDDVVQAMLLAATREEAVGQAFLVSGEMPVTWGDFWAAYEQMLGIRSTVAVGPRDMKDLRRQFRDSLSTIGLVRSGLRRHPYVLDAISNLPAVQKAYSVASKTTPAWLRLRAKAALLGPESEYMQRGGGTEKPLLPLADNLVHLYQARTRVKIDKARRLLGYTPGFDFDQGMRLTEMWARYANLL